MLRSNRVTRGKYIFSPRPLQDFNPPLSLWTSDLTRPNISSTTSRLAEPNPIFWELDELSGSGKIRASQDGLVRKIRSTRQRQELGATHQSQPLPHVPLALQLHRRAGAGGRRAVEATKPGPDEARREAEGGGAGLGLGGLPADEGPGHQGLRRGVRVAAEPHGVHAAPGVDVRGDPGVPVRRRAHCADPARHLHRAGVIFLPRQLYWGRS